ncbi:RNA polymerase sigma factor [Mucisphaera sp.]|uniref:RNA polymerase sigma factor n=1 Tax=Mucisphaera sp. TaxID=2913024 RepID=UPI003D0D8372
MADQGADLLERVAAGEPEAVRGCVDLFSPLVWAMARRRLSDREEAEDLVQDVFVELWRYADRFDRSIASSEAFVAVITRRRIVDRLRRMTARPAVSALDAAAWDVADHAEVDRTERAEEVVRAREAVATLPEDRRKVLLLSVMEGRSHGQIAELLGMPLGTVKAHVRRGLDAVRQRLGVGRSEARDDRS